MARRPARSGGADRDLPVEAARTQQRRVQDIGAVGGGDEDDAGAVTETVHLDQQLVEGLLALVVSATEARATLASDGVDLVDEDDAGAVLLGLVEHVAHTGRTHTDEHLDEVRTGDREERDTGLACHRSGEEGLTGSGRPVQQHTARDLRSQRLVAHRVLQEVLDLVQLFDGLVRTRDVGERGLRHVLVELLGLRLAEAHDAAATTALHAAHHEEEDAEQDHHRQDEQQDRCEPALLRDRGVVALQALVGDLVEDLLGRRRRILREDLGLAVGRVVAVLQPQADLLLPVVDLRLVDVVRVELRDRHGGVDTLESARVVAEVAEGVDHQQDAGNYRQVSKHSLTVHTGRPRWPVLSRVRVFRVRLPAANRTNQVTAKAPRRLQVAANRRWERSLSFNACDCPSVPSDSIRVRMCGSSPRGRDPRPAAAHPFDVSGQGQDPGLSSGRCRDLHGQRCARV